MEKITDEIFLRPVRNDEEDFWREVFCDSVSDHFSSLEMTENDLDNLLEMQFQAQNLDYRTNYPNASNDVILFNETKAGRVIHSTEHGDLHLIDLAVLSEFRNLGIGTKILKWLFGKSLRTRLPIRFYVEKMNPAFRLYEKLGFKVVTDVTSHFQMEWRPEKQKIL
jgi:ribosomal protein S18 acetylase RimI-like enzyme